jgi:glycosyltransferase involved in cell wall biosynthesis
MKIVQVQTQAEAAGAQRVSDIVGQGLRRRGHQVRTVFMYRKTEAYDDDPNADFALRERPRGILDELRAVVALIAYMRRERPDAVLAYQHFGSVFGTIAGRLAGVTRIVANQSGVPLRGGSRGVATALDRLLGTLGLYRYSIVNSAWTATQFSGYPLSYRRRIRRIDHAVAMPATAHEQRAARAAFGLPQDVRLIVSSGRLSVLKNHVTLLRALSVLPPDVHLAIAGQGPEEGALVASADELQLGKRFHLVGEVPPERMFEFLSAGDVYVFASLQETFGLAAAEAAVAGLPVVSSDLAVLREVLTADTGPAASFVPPMDALGFAAAIDNVLTDAARAERLRTAGRRLGERYAPERMCEQYEALLVD